MLSLIVARARGGAIGRGGTIPWDAPEDLAFFQRETLGGALVMGRRTWESLPVRPLKNRLNLVVSSRDIEGAVGCRDTGTALGRASQAGHRRIYGIGGARIYADLLPDADRLLVTEVDLEVAGADTFFPSVDPEEWRHSGSHVLRESGPRCVLQEYLRTHRFPERETDPGDRSATRSDRP